MPRVGGAPCVPTPAGDRSPSATRWSRQPGGAAAPCPQGLPELGTPRTPRFQHEPPRDPSVRAEHPLPALPPEWHSVFHGHGTPRTAAASRNWAQFPQLTAPQTPRTRRTPTPPAPGAEPRAPSTYPCAEAIGGRGRDPIPALLAAGAELGGHGGRFIDVGHGFRALRQRLGLLVALGVVLVRTIVEVCRGGERVSIRARLRVTVWHQGHPTQPVVTCGQLTPRPRATHGQPSPAQPRCLLSQAGKETSHITPSILGPAGSLCSTHFPIFE